MSTARHARTRAAIATFALAISLTGASTASAAVVINEIDSDPSDFVEIMNTSAAPVDIGGYVIKDSNDANSFAFPAGTIVAAGGFSMAGALGFGLGSFDSARLFAPGNLVAIDSYSWTSHAAATYGRCPDGTGVFTPTTSETPGAVNDCPVAGLAWPGGAASATVDDVGVFGSNLSGLAYQASGTSAKGVLWAVRNGPSTLYRLLWDGTKWTSDTANGWTNGKQLRYPDGAGVPDAEGVTLAGGDPNGIFVSTERNDDGLNSDTSRPAVLRYDTSTPATSLNATRDWDLTLDLPGLGKNAGLEAVAWVPDTLLTAKGLLDESTGLVYTPASYPDHGSGLFFVGVEQDGKIIAYALNQTSGTFTRVATIASGFPKIMDLEYEPESTHLWAVCDDSCNGRTATLDIAAAGANTGRFVVTGTYERPTGMPNLNNEGFAIAPQAECVGGFKPTYYADDSSTDGHALRSGTLNCTVPPVLVVPMTPGGTTTTTTTTPPAVVPPQPDTTGPTLKVAVRLTKTGAYAVRRTGKLGLVITLGERANVTIKGTARRTAASKSRTILPTTKSRSVPQGKRTLTLTLTRRVRRALRTGETVTLTVVARDTAKNATTRRASGKVR